MSTSPRTTRRRSRKRPTARSICNVCGFATPTNGSPYSAGLPEIISGATSDTELFVRLVNVLLSGIPRATAAAIVSLRNDPAHGTPKVDVLQWDRRQVAGEGFQPSERLIVSAVEGGESVVHVWESGRDAAAYTLCDDADWALCTPVPGEACQGWAIYVAGRFGTTLEPGSGGSGPNDLRDDLKFTELAASTLGSLRQLKVLERGHANLRQFLSPVVLEAASGRSWDDVLKPSETEVAVLFCDLRGFSRESEKHADDLWNLLNRVSRALGVTTHHILDQDGVVGDFHGDASMGFWGWPVHGPYLADDPQQRISDRREALRCRRRWESAWSLKRPPGGRTTRCVTFESGSALRPGGWSPARSARSTR